MRGENVEKFNQLTILEKNNDNVAKPADSYSFRITLHHFSMHIIGAAGGATSVKEISFVALPCNEETIFVVNKLTQTGAMKSSNILSY